jgi:hypothetical protein
VLQPRPSMPAALRLSDEEERRRRSGRSERFEATAPAWSCSFDFAQLAELVGLPRRAVGSERKDLPARDRRRDLALAKRTLPHR